MRSLWNEIEILEKTILIKIFPQKIKRRMGLKMRASIKNLIKTIFDFNPKQRWLSIKPISSKGNVVQSSNKNTRKLSIKFIQRLSFLNLEYLLLTLNKLHTQTFLIYLLLTCNNALSYGSYFGVFWQLRYGIQSATILLRWTSERLV